MNWKGTHTIGLIILLVIIVLINPENPGFGWILNVLVLLLFSLTIGHGITGSWKGVFVDERNKVSLSRLQLLSWTIILLSAFITVALCQIDKGLAMKITMDEQLWTLMGISTTSLVGSPLIKSTKTNKTANAVQAKKTVQLLGGTIDGAGAIDANSTVNTNGQVVVNKNIVNAGISDLFKGEETGNAAAVDLAKVQMFFFTVIIMMAYLLLLSKDITVVNMTASKGFNFPPIDSSMLALLGISHAGYLVNKAVPHSKE